LSGLRRRNKKKRRADFGSLGVFLVAAQTRSTLCRATSASAIFGVFLFFSRSLGARRRLFSLFFLFFFLALDLARRYTNGIE
jgi:hypothetical protein